MESKQKKDSKETSKPNVLYNKEWNDYAYWNGSQYVGKIVGANFYTLEKAVNNGYLPLNSTREQALAWWNSLSDISIQMPSKSHLCKVYHGDMKIHKSLTCNEIKEIWKNEVQVKELSNAYHNTEYLKPNKKQLPKELEGVVPRILTIEEKIENFRKWHNQKQFKQFNESLFKAYIFKFSEEDKEKCFEILMRNLDIQKAELINDGINLDLVFVKF